MKSHHDFFVSTKHVYWRSSVALWYLTTELFFCSVQVFGSHLSRSYLNVEIVPFVGDLQNLWPGESVDPESVSIDQQATAAHTQHDGHTLWVLHIHTVINGTVFPNRHHSVVVFFWQAVIPQSEYVHTLFLADVILTEVWQVGFKQVCGWNFHLNAGCWVGAWREHTVQNSGG